jgi:hypothetical protein
MAGFATVPDAVRAAAHRVGDATSALGGADCGRPVMDLSTALPGSVSAPAAADFAQAWSGAFKAWASQAVDHASNLALAAANYGATEDANAQHLDPAGGQIRGPR